jgi:hypothetical protein
MLLITFFFLSQCPHTVFSHLWPEEAHLKHCAISLFFGVLENQDMPWYWRPFHYLASIHFVLLRGSIKYLLLFCDKRWTDLSFGWLA